MTESTVDSRVASACRNWMRESGLIFWSSVVIFAPEASELRGGYLLVMEDTGGGGWSAYRPTK